MILRVNGDGLREEVDRCIIVFGCEGLVSLIFQGVCLEITRKSKSQLIVVSVLMEYARRTWRKKNGRDKSLV